MIKKNIYTILFSIVLILGFILRAKGFFTNPSMWHDESALAYNIVNKSYLELFSKLRFLQISPPLFLICSKFLVWFFNGYSDPFKCDFALRTIPFICGNLSIGVFYLVLKQIFNSKWAILAGISLFALNPVLINYSYEFKPYILDVLCSLIVLYILLRIDFKTIKLKKILKYSVIFGLLPWFSFASVFVILAGFLTLSFKKENPKMFSTLVLPTIASWFVYYIVFVKNSYSQNSTGMLGYWQNEFVKLDFSNAAQLCRDNFQYFFSEIPHFSIIFASLLAIAGAVLLFRNNKFSYLLISTLTVSCVIFASMLHYYPFSKRMVIFLIPMIIIYIAKITDTKRWVLGTIGFMLILIPHIAFAKHFLQIKNFNKGDFAREMILQMKNEITPSDEIVLNESSNADFFYYNTFVGLKNKVIYFKPIENENYEILLSRLDKGIYWLFLSYDYNVLAQNINTIEKWAEKNSEILSKASATQSKLIQIQIN